MSKVPIAVVLEEAGSEEYAWWLYCVEVLDHVCLPYEKIGKADVESRVSGGIVIDPRAGTITTAAGVTQLPDDLWERIVRIQQGDRVSSDGVPAADGSAPVDDGLLKCDDGIVLSYDTDRALPPGEAGAQGAYPYEFPPPVAAPMFHKPVADQLRREFLSLLFDAASDAGITLPWLHYWPAGVPAIAHMSHDSDGNKTEHGWTGLEVFDEIDVRVTWCHCYPGGYDPAVVSEIGARGHEQALHYNAMADSDIAHWGFAEFRAQYAWAQALTGVDDIISNKNHYTRWEGWHEFYLWCEQVGIQIDESRGPSKLGNVGFPFGASHVFFPIASAAEGHRRIDVLVLPLHTQDLAWAGHESIRDVILDGALEEHGVAHFLFHAVHLHTKPDVRKACAALADEARRRGMLWWTARQINEWERTRRGVSLSVSAVDNGFEVSVTSEKVLSEAGVLLALPSLTAESQFSVDGGNGTASTVTRHGRLFVELAVDLPAGASTFTLQGV